MIKSIGRVMIPVDSMLIEGSGLKGCMYVRYL